MLTFTRITADGVPSGRVSLPPDEIIQVHEGNGGVTVVTTRLGKIAVLESFDEVMKAVGRVKR